MKRILIGLLLIISSSLHSATIVQGDSTSSPFAFTIDILSKTYDRSTGTFYVGLEAAGGGALSRYQISKATRPTFSSVPKFEPVLTENSSFLTDSIELLSFSPQANTKPILAFVPLGNELFASTALFALFNDDSAQAETNGLNDANTVSPSTTSGIIGLTSSSSYIFAAVKPNGSDTFWGDINSGIALVNIGASTNSITLSIKDAPSGVDGNLAALLDKNTALLKSTGPDVLFTATQQVAMVWDETFERLFVGVQIQSDPAGTAKSVVVGRIENGALIFQAIAPDSALTAGDDQIVVTADGDTQLGPKHIAVLHASTGPDYLIVDCNATPLTTSGFKQCNRIFALPLVNDTTNPSSATNGTLANINMFDATERKFTTVPDGMNQLSINNAITNPEAVVGAGDLPIKDEDEISDLVVVGDAVYVSIGDNFSTTQDADRGIFYSQAMFDDEGKIIRWTPWTKRAIPFNAFPGTTLPGGATHNGSVKFLEVDGKTGNIWFVEGTTDQTVGITSWTTGTSSTSLITKVRETLSKSSYSVLDLDQATRGFLQTTAHRYALFGGVNKVVFARTSQAVNLDEGGADQIYASSPQTPITDYSLAENFLITNLPENAGCCQVLEYSRTSTTAGDDNNLNYFFAGTETGLFVFTNENGQGFDATNLGLLNAGNPGAFDGRSWQKIETISGSVLDIKTSGYDHTLFVLTSESTTDEPLKSTLYSIPFASTTGAMFASANIRTIAQTGVGVFENIFQFYGIQIIATGDFDATTAGDKEQLVLTTNQGLYYSNADQATDGIQGAANQNAADWTLIEDTANSLTTAKTMFNGIAGPDTPIRQTVWPFSIVDRNNFKTFDRGTINQFSGYGTDGNTVAFNEFFIPQNFNADSTANAFSTLDRMIYFHSDGGRRFFLLNRTIDPPNQIKLSVLPYNVAEWNCTQPSILTYPPLTSVNQMYWIKQIGATGILMIGTGTGVIGLE